MAFEYHPAALAADTTDYQANTLDRIAKGIGYGGGSALASGLLSIYNTFVTEPHEVNVQKFVERFGGEAMGSYYEENKDYIDIAGFVGASLIPGSLGVKALKMARSGLPAGNVSKFLNYAPSRRDEYLQAAMKQTAAAGGVRPGLMSANRLKQVGWEAADGVMLGAAAELAIAATMFDSPLLEDATIGDMAYNAVLGIGISGVAGGLLGAMAQRGTLKATEKAVQLEARNLDVLAETKQLGLLQGTDALILAESLVRTPEARSTISHIYKFDGEARTIDLPVSEALQLTRREAQQLGTDRLKLKFNELANGDNRVGQAYYEFIQKRITDARNAGRSADETIQEVTGYLNHLKSVEALDLERIALDKRKFYISLQSPAQAATRATDTPLEAFARLISPRRTATTAKQAYRLVDDADLTSINVVRFDSLPQTSIRGAFRQNPEIDALQLRDGTIRINPLSTKIVKHFEAEREFKQLIDLETGSMVADAPATIGNVMRSGKLSVFDTVMVVNGKQYNMAASAPIRMSESPMESSVRWLWAANLDEKALMRITGGNIATDDLPLLQRYLELYQEGKITPAMQAKVDEALEGIGGTEELSAYLEQYRRDWLAAEFTNWQEVFGSVPDTRVLAAHLNTTSKWVEETIAAGFDELQDGVGKILPTAAAAKPTVVQATWNFKAVPNMAPEDAYRMNMGPSHLASLELSLEYQRNIRVGLNTRAAYSVLGEDGALFEEAPRFLSRDADSGGAGASVLGASNASYGERARLFVQNTGRAVAQVTAKRVDNVVQSLAPFVNELRINQKASAELGAITNMLRSSKRRYTFDTTANEDRLVDIEVLRAAQKQSATVDDILQEVGGNVDALHPYTIDIENSVVANFLQASARRNAVREQKHIVLDNAAGITRNVPKYPVVYAPPINTARYQYHAYVKPKEHLGLGSGTTVITARTEQQMRELVAKLQDDFEVYYDKNAKDYFTAKGEYEYAKTLNQASVNSAMLRKAKLFDIVPETRFENINEDWLMWHAKQEEKLVRDSVQTLNREFFSELELLSERHRLAAESVTGGIGSKAKAKIEDPFGDYIKTALNISKQQEFPLLDSVNDFVDKIGYKLGETVNRAFRDAKAGVISWEEANAMLVRKGAPVFYKDEAHYLSMNERAPKNLVKLAFQKINMALATTMLRFDFANSLVNIISTPIMLGTELASIKRMIANNDELAGKLNELMSLPVPGQPGRRVPGTTHLIANSINNFFGANKEALIARYQNMGAMKNIVDQYHQMLGLTSVDFRLPVQGLMKNADEAVEIAAKITGNTFSEDFTRFVSADVMRQLTDPLVAAGRMSLKEQDAYISTFVNRVQGNYVTSQRPIIFQGTTGAAVSLFQTYAFNVLQQLFRHMERGDKKTLAIFAGLQSSIFGLNGLPFFDAVNTHLISNLGGNEERRTAYDVLPGVNKELGDWLLYGTASAFPLFTGDTPAFFTRGDINPRHALVLPTAIADVPAISASMKLLGTISDFATNVGGGADLEASMLNALMHQGWNRPLAGFAQVFAGRSTDAKGALISASNELQTLAGLSGVVDRAFSLEGVTRMMGARPMDEAVALNAMYRNKSFEAMDRARIERLGTIVRTKLYNNEMPSEAEMEDFMLRYTRSGGRIENFNQALQRWSRDANMSIVNQLSYQQGSNYAITLKNIMGGEQIEDYLHPAPR